MVAKNTMRKGKSFFKCGSILQDLSAEKDGNVGRSDFGFLEGIPENRRGVQTGHQPTRYFCVVQFDHSAHRTLNALGLAQVQDQA